MKYCQFSHSPTQQEHTVKTGVFNYTLTGVLENTYSFWGVVFHLMVLNYTLHLQRCYQTPLEYFDLVWSICTHTHAHTDKHKPHALIYKFQELFMHTEYLKITGN